MIKKLATILIIFLPGLLSGQGEDNGSPEDRYLRSQLEQRQLDRNRWSDLTEGFDYSEKKRRSPQQTPDRNETGEPGRNRNARSIFGEGAGAAIARFLLIALGAVGIAFLVRSMLGYGRVKDKKITRDTEAGIDIRKIEADIHEADLEDYIDQAKAAGRFNLAIRLYYLAILKELSLQKLIKWKVDKTNSEYLREMRQHENSSDFRRLTQIFERSWYGDRPLDAATFTRLEPGFRRFLALLAPVKSSPAV